MVVDVDFIFAQVELRFLDLAFSRQLWVKLKLLSHLLNRGFFVWVMVVLELEVLVPRFLVRIKRNTSVDEFVLAPIVVFEGLLTDVLLAVDEAILHPVVVEVQLS